MLYDVVAKIAEEQHLAITAVEELAGLGRGSIGKWRNSTPKLDSVAKVAKVLNVPLASLVNEYEGQ